jgi:hypothetical protein
MDIYRQYGFRTGAGEEAEPFGLENYPKAFYATWKYAHRTALGTPDVTLAELAAQEGVPPRFVEHIWEVVNQPSLSPPTVGVVQMWRDLPEPDEASASGAISAALERQVRRGVDGIYSALQQLHAEHIPQNFNREERPVLTPVTVVLVEAQDSLSVRQQFSVPANGQATVHLYVESASSLAGQSRTQVVLWKNPRLRFASEDGVWGAERPLSEVIPVELAQRMYLGIYPDDPAFGASDFSTNGTGAFAIPITASEGARNMELMVDAVMDPKRRDDGAVRVYVSDNQNFPAERTTSAAITDPGGRVQELNDGLMYFAENLPEVSHMEAAPADRDPIPMPFIATYNRPERNYYHTYVKYTRADDFLTNKVLDEATRRELDIAWDDLLSAFDYHETILRFAAQKYGVDLEGKSVADVSEEKLDEFPDESRRILKNHVTNYRAMRTRLQAAEASHVDDVIDFASSAWRRPVTEPEARRLREFYTAVRQEMELDHTAAIRAMLSRVLVSPSFLYRAESPEGPEEVVALSNWELANRLSYFLWSSAPDEELTRAAAAGELLDPEKLVAQANRMLKDPKSRRLATEFFGQWLGFYQFDEFRGVDLERFPEFDEQLRASLYNEAISFFEYIIRENRPLGEVLFADYTFLNARLMEHYGMPTVASATDELVKVDGTSEHHRGGLFGLGAVLTTTSAPLRTSPVKRGSWVATRVMGTVIPPPPPDVGTLPADDVADDGKSIRERLEAHRANARCANCHSRIDPFGFALEYYDSVGRWRETYRDGQAVEVSGVLSDGTVISGLDGLREYLESQKTQVRRAMGAKLLGYALGRSEQISDRVLIDEMVTDTGAGEPGFASLVEKIVASKQFRYKRLVSGSESVDADTTNDDVSQSIPPVVNLTTQGR